MMGLMAVSDFLKLIALFSFTFSRIWVKYKAIVEGRNMLIKEFALWVNHLVTINLIIGV
jgi:hypothetical protein